jgi:predicted anti-sigma-YlaC factor YlaD
MKKNVIAFIVLISILLSACSVEKILVNKMADMGGSDLAQVFTSDEDPELIADAFPIILKMYELLLQMSPESRELLLTTGQGFAMYAYAFVQLPAEMLPDEEFEEAVKMTQRAKKLYIRGRNYILKALELKYPEFADYIITENWENIVGLTDAEDVPYLYWSGMAWMGAFTTDLFDAELNATKQRAVALVARVLELDETYDNGGVHSFFLSYYAAMPDYMGGDEVRAREHFQKALEYSNYQSATPYVALASTISINNQDVDEFRELLNTALEIDPDEVPETRLLNILAQRKAQWLLDHIDYFFLLDEGEF